MIKSLLPAFVLLTFTACQNSDGGGEGTGVPAQPQNDRAATSAPATTPMPTTSSTTTSDGVALNPPHGEPGHVCEIPVGQPLDGSGSSGTENIQMQPPAGMDVSTTVIDPSQTQTPEVQLPSGTPNPAHGLPGHVCAVGVGEPLP